MTTPVSTLGSELADHPVYKARVKFFMQKAAASVIGEVGATVKRNNYAVSVLNGAASVSQMAIATVTNGTISSSIDMTIDGFGVSDGDLEFTVSSLWDDFAHTHDEVLT